MKTAGRVVLALSFFMALLGCGLSAWGYAESQVGGKASAEPVAVDLAKLEAGQKATDNHIQIGPHYAIYDSSMYLLKQKKKGRFGRAQDTDKIENVYYPIVSADNPEAKELERLEKQFGDLNDVPDNIDLPVPKKFVILVKTRRFKTVDDIPLVFFRKENSIRGLVINEITSLTREEKNMIKEDFPDINFKDILILEEGRTPVSSETSLGAMVCGGSCCVVSSVAAVGGVVMIVVGWASGGKKTKKRKNSEGSGEK
jgi:hypothetical protein